MMFVVVCVRAQILHSRTSVYLLCIQKLINEMGLLYLENIIMDDKKFASKVFQMYNPYMSKVYMPKTGPHILWRDTKFPYFYM